MAVGARGGDSISGVTLEYHARLHQLRRAPQPIRHWVANARPPSPKSWQSLGASGRDAWLKHPPVFGALPERSQRRSGSALQLHQVSSWKGSPNASCPFGNETCEVLWLRQRGRAKRERTVVRSHAQTRLGCISQSESSLRPGLMLVLLSEQNAVRKAQKLRFRVTSDPVDFASQVARIPRSQRRGHVVLASPTSTDFAVCAAVAAALMGCFHAAPNDFLSSSPRGITYSASYSDPATAFHLAVSADLAQEFPTLPGLLRCIAQAPGSRLCYYLSERKLQKFFKKKTRNKGSKATCRLSQTVSVLAQVSQAAQQPKKLRALYITPRQFLLRLEGKTGHGCPGCPSDAI